MSEQAWNDYLKACAISRVDERIATTDAHRLAALMYKALISTNKRPLIKQLTSGERRWIHERATAIRVQSSSEGEQTDELKDVRIVKPKAWDLERSLAMGPPKLLNKKVRKGRYLSEKDKRMAKWSTHCDECDDVLNAESAFYHHGGMGPVCERCIDEDPELEGLKWECKASFFD